MSRSAAFEIGRTLIGQAAFVFSADFTAFGFRSMTRRYATNAIYALRIRRERARRLDEQRRERGFDAVTDEPAYARRVVPLPRWVDGQRNVGGPSRNRARWKDNRVADGFVSAAAPIEHPRQHRDVEIRVIVHPHLTLCVVEPVESADVLAYSPAP